MGGRYEWGSRVRGRGEWEVREGGRLIEERGMSRLLSEELVSTTNITTIVLGKLII